jgi:hypothetical protein
VVWRTCRQQQLQQQHGSAVGAGSSSMAAAGGVDEQLVGQLTGALVSFCGF